MKVRRPATTQARAAVSQVLPAHPRLSGSLAAGLADPQAEGNSPRPGGAETGGTLRPVERQTRKPPSADPLGMARHPHADRSEEVDLTAAGDDVQGDPVASITIAIAACSGTLMAGLVALVSIGASGSHSSCQASRKRPASKGWSDAW